LSSCAYTQKQARSEFLKETTIEGYGTIRYINSPYGSYWALVNDSHQTLYPQNLPHWLKNNNIRIYYRGISHDGLYNPYGTGNAIKLNQAYQVTP